MAGRQAGWVGYFFGAVGHARDIGRNLAQSGALVLEAFGHLMYELLNSLVDILG